ncbi:MAG: hypothetical protein RJA70_1834 [Pseudomonadota bacterium]
MGQADYSQRRLPHLEWLQRQHCRGPRGRQLRANRHLTPEQRSLGEAGDQALVPPKADDKNRQFALDIAQILAQTASTAGGVQVVKREDMSMNKILIVGHPQSGYQEVERLLRACGMSPALPSRREGFSPNQVSETLCKAHSTPPLERLGNDREVQQVDVAPVWQSLAMDLMLGNIDQPLWGWADPKAVHLLEYWLKLDPSLHFILVYDRPHSVLTRIGLQEASSLTREALQQRLDAWSAYNAAVLGFHLRHPERCLLVHSEQVHRSAEASLQQVRARIDAPLNKRLEGPEASMSMEIITGVKDGRTLLQTPSPGDEPQLDASSLSILVAGALLKDQSGSLSLYEELQASANLPLEIELAQGEDPGLGMEAWLSLVAQQEKLRNQRELSRQLAVGRDRAENLAHERERLIEQERQLRMAEQQDMAQQLASLQRESARVEETQSQRIEAFLHQEKMANERLAAEEAARQQALQQLSAVTAEVESLKAQPVALEPDLAQAEENELLLTQLHQVQEELERYYLENQRLQMSAGSGPTSEPVTSQPLALFGAADRVKQQLSYRLGSCMINNSRSLGGWLRMPWALFREARRYRRDRQLANGRKLPPLSAYRDASEAQRIKQQLSYRLGQLFITNSRSPLGWLRMPFVFRQAVRRFREQRSE